MSEDLNGWPEYENYFTSGYVRHHHLTHVVRKARAQLCSRDAKAGMYDGFTHPINLWVMSRPDQGGDVEEAILIGVFREAPAFMTTGDFRYKGTAPRRVVFQHVTVRLPKERRNRKNAQTLNYCEEAIRELMVWNKMETT